MPYAATASIPGTGKVWWLCLLVFDSEIIIIRKKTHTFTHATHQREWLGVNSHFARSHSPIARAPTYTDNQTSSYRILRDWTSVLVFLVAFWATIDWKNAHRRRTIVSHDGSAHNAKTISMTRTRWMLAFRCAWTPSVLPRSLRQYRFFVNFIYRFVICFNVILMSKQSRVSETRHHTVVDDNDGHANGNHWTLYKRRREQWKMFVKKNEIRTLRT